MKLRKMLEDPQIVSQGQCPPHSDHPVCFAGEAKPRVLELDGVWQFRYSPDLEQRMEGFEQPGASLQDWEEVTLPAHIELLGHGMPQYTDTAYPWDGREQLMPGELPRFIPVGQFVRSVVLPESWRGQCVHLRLEGVEPAFRVFCNGRELGYGEDSFTPSEFDVTKDLHPGENRIAVEVYRWASGSWLEDQDFWRFWGIFRSVKLLCLPVSRIEDLTVRAGMDGRLQARLLLTGKAEQVQAVLVAPDGQTAGSWMLPVEAGQAQLEEQLAAPLLWSAEEPNLYTLELGLLAGGTLLSVTHQPVGFRTICIEDGLLKLNGQRLVLHGANRHEWNAQRGRVVSLAEMERDARLMKQNNINAVRTSHYPNRSEWYDLCDRLGLYMIDEANLETHGTCCGKSEKPENQMFLLPDGRPEWKEAVFSRARNMQQRDKNHPAILIWSCGNESMGGETLYEMSQLLRQEDGSRPVQYEGVQNDDRYPETSDLISTMYFPANRAEELLKKRTDRPYIQVEYAHAMGNSCGALHTYIDLEEREPRYQGGFVWDWIDQQLLRDGRLHYGGDFRDCPNSGDFSADGLLFADGTPSPKLAAVKAAYAPFRFKFGRDGLEIINKSLFTNLSQYSLRLSVQGPEGEISHEERTVDCPPLERCVVPFAPKLPEKGELWAEASIRLREAAPWAEAGHEIAFAQHTLRSRAEAESGWRMIDGGEHLGFVNQNLEAVFRKNNGRLCSLRVKGREWLASPLQATFWRAPVSNDAASHWPFEKGQWKAADLYQKKESFEFSEEGSGYQVVSVFRLPTQPELVYSIRFRFEKGEQIQIQLDCMLPEGMEAPFVFGAQLAAHGENWVVEYDGLGPVETAADRTEGARRGRWQLDARSTLTPYMTPQDCGQRYGTRSACCGGLRLEGETPFAFSALCWTPHELENAAHARELPPSEKIILRLLSENCGVGGDNTWGARPQPEDQLKKRALHFAMTLTAEEKN